MEVPYKNRIPPRARRDLLLRDDALPQDVEGVAIGDGDEPPAGVAAVLPGVRQSLPPPPPLDHKALPDAGVPLVAPPAPPLADVAVLLSEVNRVRILDQALIYSCCKLLIRL